MTEFERLVTDCNNLYEAYRKTIKGSIWKSATQEFELDYLHQITKLSQELRDRTYHTSPCHPFTVDERGHKRSIRANTVRDRVVRRCLCDQVLIPELRKHLIYDNGASLTGKGVSFTRRRLEQHLHHYYAKHGTNHGYILLIDFSRYYDNIRHDILREQIRKYIDDEFVHWLLDEIFESFKIDVSYLSDEEYETCLEQKFDLLVHDELPAEILTGDKFMYKSLGIGDQTSQICSVFFPTTIDTYCKIVKGIHYYGRYMDDTYIIADNKDDLHEILDDITKLCKELGIFMNEKKTQISRLEDGFKFMQIHYRLTDTGHLIRKMNKDRVTAMRRRLKGYKRLYDAGVLALEEICNAYKSWMGSFAKYLSKQQRINLDTLFCSLFEREENSNGNELYDDPARRHCAIASGS